MNLKQNDSEKKADQKAKVNIPGQEPIQNNSKTPIRDASVDIVAGASQTDSLDKMKENASSHSVDKQDIDVNSEDNQP